jgi:hypothetical protein
MYGGKSWLQDFLWHLSFQAAASSANQWNSPCKISYLQEKGANPSESFPGRERAQFPQWFVPKVHSPMYPRSITGQLVNSYIFDERRRSSVEETPRA